MAPSSAINPAASTAATDGWSGLSALPDERAGGAAGDVATYAAAVYAAQALTFFGGVIQKGLLGPRLMGDWALATSLMVFLGVLPLGMFSGATREVPAERGRGDLAKAALLADSASSFTVAALGLGGLATVAIALLLGASWSPELRYGLVCLGLLAPLRSFVDCHTLVLQITKRFRAVAAATVLGALLGLTVQTGLVWAIGYWGLFVGLLVTAVATLLLWRVMGLTSFHRPAFTFRIDVASLRALLPVGVPIMVLSQIWLLFIAIDSLLVARLLDATNLGYYTLATSVTNYIMLMPKSIAAALFSRMQERFAPDRDPHAIRHYATDVQMVMALLILPLLVGSAFILVPVLARHALPSFVPGIPALRILAAGSFLLALVNLPVEVMITTGRRWSVTFLMVSALIANAVGNYIAMGVLHEGLQGAAFATALSYLVLVVSATAWSLDRILDRRDVVRHLATMFGAFAYSVAALWALELAFHVGRHVGLWRDVAYAITQLVVFIVAMLPWFVLLERRHGALTTARAVLLSVVRGRPQPAPAEPI